jgi:mono/diheme cytochrome c family protein
MNSLKPIEGWRILQSTVVRGILAAFFLCAFVFLAMACAPAENTNNTTEGTGNEAAGTVNEQETTHPATGLVPGENGTQELTPTNGTEEAGGKVKPSETTEGGETTGEQPTETEPPAEGTETVTADWAAVGRILTDNCSRCHGETAMGGMNITSYATLMEANVITAGDPDASLIVTKIKGGEHSGQLSDADLAILVQWIKDGAKE